MTHWRDLPQFAGVDLEDSRVLGWSYAGPPYRLTVALDACVLPPPNGPPGARPVHRPARLVFDGVRAAHGLTPPDWPLPRPGDAPPPLDTLGGLHRDPDGAWRFALRWGEARVECDAVALDVDAT